MSKKSIFRFFLNDKKVEFRPNFLILNFMWILKTIFRQYLKNVNFSAKFVKKVTFCEICPILNCIYKLSKKFSTKYKKKWFFLVFLINMDLKMIIHAKQLNHKFFPVKSNEKTIFVWKMAFCEICLTLKFHINIFYKVFKKF